MSGSDDLDRDPGSPEPRATLPLPMDDRTIGAVGLLIGIAIIVLTPSQVTESSLLVPGSDTIFLRGGFFPRVVGTLVAGCGAFLLVSEIKRGTSGTRTPWPVASVPRRLVVAATIFLVSIGGVIAVMALVGFRAAVVVLAVPLARWFGAPTRWHAVAVGVATAVLVHLLFTQAFSVPLPARIF